MNLEILRRDPGHTDRPPLLFVHGAWHGAWCWGEHFLDHFAALGYPCVAPSLPGHAGSAAEKPLRWLRIDDYVDAVAQVAASLPSPPVLIGHSMGGFVVQHFLARHPARAGVLLASVPPGGVWRTALRMLCRHPWRFLRANLGLSLYPLVSTPALVRELFYSEALPEADLRRYAAAVGDESYRAFLDMLMLRLPRPAQVRVPVRVLGGALDAVFTPAEVMATARAYGTRARIFADCAHNLMLEPGWPEVADDIHAWIEAGFRAPREAGQ